MKIFFEKRLEIAPGIWEYTFKPERTVDFEPGQYVDLYLGVHNDPRGANRTFTITSLPSDPYVTFVLKHFGLQSPYKQFMQDLRPSDAATINDAMGDLILPKSLAVPLVFTAGGIGIASYLSMIKTLLARKEERQIFFFYQVRSRREQVYRELFASYPLQLKTISIAPNQLTAEQIKDSTPPSAQIYLSGSQKFVDDLQNGFEALGTPRSQIVFDYYDGYSEL